MIRLCYFALILFVPSLFAETLEDAAKRLLTPDEFSYCLLSPSGRYVAFERNMLPSTWQNRKYNGPSNYMVRVYIMDLESGSAVVAGPRDSGKQTDLEDWTRGWRWGDDGNLILMTWQEIMSVDPSTGEPLERYNLHARLRDETGLPLPSSLDDPFVFYDINWSKGASVTMYAYYPRESKFKRFNQPGLLKDTVVTVYRPIDQPSVSLRSAAKDSAQGFSWELNEEGEMEVVPFELDPDWRTVPHVDGTIRRGEKLVQRYIEQGEWVSEFRLFDYRKSAFVGGSVTVRREDLENARYSLTRESIDALRASSGTVGLREIADPQILWLSDQLSSAYPLASFRIMNTSRDGHRSAVRVSAQNRTGVYFLFDAQKREIRKLLEADSKRTSVPISAGKFIEYESTFERGGKGVLAYTPALERSGNTEVVVSIADEPLFDYDWGFSSRSRFLSAKGYDHLQIMIPWELQLKVARSSSPEAYQAALADCRHFVDTALAAFLKEPGLENRGVSFHYALHANCATLLPGLPVIDGVEAKNVYLINPRFHVGLADSSFARIGTVNQFAHKQAIDPKSWRTLMQPGAPELDAPVTLIWRENNLYWLNAYYGTESQIASFERYCKDHGIEYRSDDWSYGYWRNAEPWKMSAAITVGLWENISGVDSKILDTWR